LNFCLLKVNFWTYLADIETTLQIWCYFWGRHYIRIYQSSSVQTLGKTKFTELFRKENLFSVKINFHRHPIAISFLKSLKRVLRIFLFEKFQNQWNCITIKWKICLHLFDCRWYSRTIKKREIYRGSKIYFRKFFIVVVKVWFWENLRNLWIWVKLTFQI
jgi:hypothetical protein